MSYIRKIFTFYHFLVFTAHIMLWTKLIIIVCIGTYRSCLVDYSLMTNEIISPHSKKYFVLQDRVGGRIATFRKGNYVADLGAMVVTGLGM